MPGTARDPVGPDAPAEPMAQAGASPPVPGGLAESDPADVARELVDLAEKLIGNPAEARDAILEEVERRIAHQGSGGLAGGDEARGSAPPLVSGQGRGVAMATHTDAQAPPRRAFAGFDPERETYARLKPGLLARAEVKYVAIVGEECVGPVDSHAAAERAGYAAFGRGPLFIEQVVASERVAEVTRLVAP